jgi:type III restriction enzyme
MKFTLKDYQEEAVREVLANLRKARRRWREDSDKHAFSLTAATGAGKTVMAAAACCCQAGDAASSLSQFC